MSYAFSKPAGNAVDQQPSAPSAPMQSQYGYPQYQFAGPQAQTHNQQYTTNIVVGQPMGQSERLGQPQNVRRWTTGICGCFEDMGSCCFAYWCYPCFLCNLADNMNENCCGPICFGGGFKCLGLHYPGFPNVFVTAMRSRIRAQYGIQGTICGDVCCTCCCECCVATQIARELKYLNAAR